jgi:ubiquinone/menaquinone biosynthesis C-methylase UbiE
MVANPPMTGIADPARGLDSYAVVVPYQQWQFHLGLHGLAILRLGSIGSDAQLAEHVAALRTPPDPSDGSTRVLSGTERDVAAGYARWAAVYDAPGNPLIAHEEPVVHDILDSWPASLRVLDAACGTGRHTTHLARLGHLVTGVDASVPMLAQARAKRGDLALVEAQIERLPFPDAAFDAAVCALLFDHLPRIDGAIAELARVVRPGGRVLISNIHPAMALAGAHAAFRDAASEPNFIRSHHHPVSSYVGAFVEHGLTIKRCAEPCWSTAGAMTRFPFISESVARHAMSGLPMALVWDLAR